MEHENFTLHWDEISVERAIFLGKSSSIYRLPFLDRVTWNLRNRNLGFQATCRTKQEKEKAWQKGAEDRHVGQRWHLNRQPSGCRTSVQPTVTMTPPHSELDISAPESKNPVQHFVSNNQLHIKHHTQSLDLDFYFLQMSTSAQIIFKQFPLNKLPTSFLNHGEMIELWCRNTNRKRQLTAFSYLEGSSKDYGK